MFDVTELQVLAAALDTEAEFFRSVERHGEQSTRQLSILAALKLKVVEALEAAAVEAAKPKKEIAP